MNYGIILFIYDRPQCTAKVLEALKRNHIGELYVFQDGLGEKTDQTAWKQNEELIRQIDWCKVVFEQNKQKATSLDRQIVYGINKVFEQKEAMILIEDDCVISDDCILFMEKCLTQYQDHKQIIDIGAYLEPVRVPMEYSLPIVAAGIPAGQVWGTWKDRWEEFQAEYALIKQIGNAMRDNPMFNSCGYPIKKILTEYWMLSTWDLWWSIYVLMKEGISIRPTGNKVYNIGFEHAGTHTSGESPWVVPICDKTGLEEEFPADVRVEPWAEAEFQKFYQDVNGERPLVERQTYYRNCLEKWVELKQQGRSIGDILAEKNVRRVAIYGIGSIGKLLAEDLCGKIEIAYFVVTDKKANSFLEYPVYSREELSAGEEDAALLVIPGYDLEKITESIGKKFSSVYPMECLCILAE